MNDSSVNYSLLYKNETDFDSRKTLIYFGCEDNYIFLNNYRCGFIYYYYYYYESHWHPYINATLNNVVNDHFIQLFVLNLTAFISEINLYNYTNYPQFYCNIGTVTSPNIDSCDNCPNNCSKCYYGYYKNNILINFTDIQTSYFQAGKSLDPSIFNEAIQLFCEECYSGFALHHNLTTCTSCSTINSNCSSCAYGNIISEGNNYRVNISDSENLYCLNCSSSFGIVQIDNQGNYFKTCKLCLFNCYQCFFYNENTQYCIMCSDFYSQFSILDWDTGKCYYLNQTSNYYNDEFNYTLHFPNTFSADNQSISKYNLNTSLCYSFGRITYKKTYLLFCSFCSNAAYYILNVGKHAMYCANYDTSTYSNVFKNVSFENLDKILQNAIYKDKLELLLNNDTLSLYTNEDDYLFYERRSLCVFPLLQLTEGAQYCVNGPAYCNSSTCQYKNNNSISPTYECKNCKYDLLSIDFSLVDVYNFLADNLGNTSYSFKTDLSDLINYFQYRPYPVTLKYDGLVNESTYCYSCHLGCSACSYSKNRTIYDYNSLRLLDLYNQPMCTQCSYSPKKLNNYIFDYNLKTCRFCPSNWSGCKSYLNKTIIIDCSSKEPSYVDTSGAFFNDLNNLNDIFDFFNTQTAFYYMNELVIENMTINIIIKSQVCSLKTSLLIDMLDLTNHVYSLGDTTINIMGDDAENGNSITIQRSNKFSIQSFDYFSIKNLNFITFNILDFRIYISTILYVDFMNISFHGVGNVSDPFTSYPNIKLIDIQTISHDLRMKNIIMDKIQYFLASQLISLTNIGNLIVENFSLINTNLSFSGWETSTSFFSLFYLITNDAINYYWEQIRLENNTLISMEFLTFGSLTNKNEKYFNLIEWSILNNRLNNTDFFYITVQNVLLMNISGLTMYNNMIYFNLYFMNGQCISLSYINLTMNNFIGSTFLSNTIILKENSQYLNFMIIDNAYFKNNYFKNEYNIIDIVTTVSTGYDLMQQFHIQNIYLINQTFIHQSNQLFFLQLTSQLLPILTFSNISCLNTTQTQWFYADNINIFTLKDIKIEACYPITNLQEANSNAFTLMNLFQLTMQNITLRYFSSETSIIILTFDEVFTQNSTNISILNCLFDSNYLKPESYAIISMIELTCAVIIPEILIDSSTFQNIFLDTSDYSFLASTSSIYFDISFKGSTVTIQNSIFLSNSPPNIYIYADNILFVNNTFLYAYYILPEFLLQYSQSINPKNIDLNASAITSFCYISYIASVEFDGCIFNGSINNFVGAMTLDGQGFYLAITISNCIFNNTLSKSDAGVLKITTTNPNNYVFIDNTTFFHNLCYQKGGIIFFDGTGYISLHLSNSRIYDSYSASLGSIIYVEKAVGVNLELYSLIIENKNSFNLSNDFYNKIGNFFDIKVSTNVKILIENLTVLNIICDCSFLFLTNNGFLTINNSIFTNNIFGGLGIMYLSGLYDIEFYNNTFNLNVLNSTEHLSQNDLSSFWTFNYIKASLLTIISPARMIINSSTFSNNSCISCLGGCLYLYLVSSVVNISISNSYFYNNSAMVGGSIFIYHLSSKVGNNPSFIYFCSFMKNKATYYGGAIYITNGYMNLSNLNFIENYIETINISRFKELYKDNTEYSLIENKGGAIFYESYVSILSIIYLKESLFQGNTALIGAAIYVNDLLIDLEEITNKDNFASFYGNNRYHLPAKIKLFNNDQIGYGYQENDTVFFSAFQSGATMSDLIFKLYDEDDRVIDIFENEITLNIYMIPLDNTKDKYALNGIKSVTENKIQGSFNFSALILIGNVSNTYRLVINSTSVTSDFVFEIKFRQCENGEIYDPSLNVCSECVLNSYALNLAAATCKSCDFNSMSYCMRNVIKIRSNFWRRDNLTDLIEECKVTKNICLGDVDDSNITLPAGINCYEGHIGALCGSCDMYGRYWSEKWSKKSTYSCGKCKDIEYNIIILITLLLLNLLSIWLSVKGVSNMIDSDFKNKANKMTKTFVKTKTKKLSIYLKILMTYFQIVSTITNFDLTIPSDIYSFPDTVGNPTQILLYSTDCFIVNSIQYPPYFYIKAAITFFMPMIYLFLFFLLYYLLVLVRLTIKRPKIFYTASFFVIIYLQPNVVSILISILSCRLVANGLYIKADLAYECYTAEHNLYSMIFSLPALLIWVVGIPLFIIKNLYQSRKKLYAINTKIKYGFLYIEYNPKVFYWEFVKMYEKIIIILFVSLFDTEINIKGMMILFTIFVYFVLLLYMKPYKTIEYNRIDISSCIVCFFTIFFAVFAYKNTFLSLIYISYSIIILINLAFIYVIGKKLIYSLLEDQAENFEIIKPVLKKYLPCCFFWIKLKKPLKTLVLWKKVQLAVSRYLRLKEKKAIKNKNSLKLIETNYFEKNISNNDDESPARMILKDKNKEY